MDKCRQGNLLGNAPRLLELQTLSNGGGSLTVIESDLDGLFPIRRVYYLHALAEGASRGSHAHRTLTQLMIAVAGSFHIQIECGGVVSNFVLRSPRQGLLIPPMAWRNLTDFSAGAVCLVLASGHYDEQEYIRDYAEFSALSVG